MEFLIFIVTCIFYFPLTIVNFLLVRDSGYLKDTGKTVSKVVNRDLRTLFNKTLKKKDCGHEFGNQDETVSCVLGKNQMLDTLTPAGRRFVYILHICEKHHCIKSVKDPEFQERKEQLMNPK